MNKSKKISAPEVLIIGGGVAGISAAMWCRELGLRCKLIESSETLGGQISKIYSPITNYPGILKIHPSELIETLGLQITVLESPKFYTHAIAFSVDPISVEVGSGKAIVPKALIIATGVRRQLLDVPGEIEFAGRGVVDSGAKDPSAVAGNSVLIVGGGDAALENAAILSPFAKKVYIAHRRVEFAARDEFLDQAKHLPNIEFLTNTTIVKFEGTDTLETATIRNSATGTETKLEVQNALIRIGVKPNSELFSTAIKVDSAGYIEVDSACRTSVPGVFAAGDVANPVGPTIASAVGLGATAAKAAFVWLSKNKSL